MVCRLRMADLLPCLDLYGAPYTRSSLDAIRLWSNYSTLREEQSSGRACALSVVLDRHISRRRVFIVAQAREWRERDTMVECAYIAQFVRTE